MEEKTSSQWLGDSKSSKFLGLQKEQKLYAILQIATLDTVL